MGYNITICAVCTVVQNSAESSILLLKMWSAVQQKLDTFQRQTFEKISLCHCKEGGLYVLKDMERLIKEISKIFSLRGQRFVTGGIPEELKAFCECA